MNILIVGAGYVGEACAEHFVGQGHRVLCWTFSVESALALREKGLQAVSGDCGQFDAWQGFDFPADAVLFCPSSRGGDAAAYERVYLHGLAMTLQHISPEARVLYTSSTSVYGQQDGSWVDETSITIPDSATSKILLATEKLALDRNGVVLRLSAIYGPGRLALNDRLLTGTARLPVNSEKVINQIHLQDVVGAVDWLLQRPMTQGEIFNVTDNQPASYREIYEWLCQRHHLTMPPVEDNDVLKKRGLTDKKVSNQKLSALGWRPQFPSFKEGYAAVL